MGDDPPLWDTRDGAYAKRLVALESARWKQILDVQAPYRWHLRALKLGRTLDVGCGIGRNLAHLGTGSVGVDHNAESVAVARSRGLTALTSEEFNHGSLLAVKGGFDSMLVAHVVEHMEPATAVDVVTSYLPYIRPRGSVVFITPQERGYASDPTHVWFCDKQGLRGLASEIGLGVRRTYSFPFPRMVGKVFTYNEFVLLAQVS